MDPEANNCRNCGQRTITKYCANCGQRSSVYKVTLKETFEDLADNLFSLSAPLITTIKNLFSNPGKILREYLGGKRKKYYKPVSFFILTTAIYLFLRWSIGFEIQGEINLDQSTMDQVDPDSLTRARDFMFQNINSLAFFFVLSMSLMLKAFFFNKYMFTEYVAVAFYLNGVYILFSAINILFIKYINPQIQYLAILFMGVYFIYAMIRFFRDQPFWVSIKSVLAFFLAYAGYIFLAFNLSYLIVILK